MADDILNRRPKRVERTRAGWVDRLEEAVEKVWAAAREQADLKPRARVAKQAWAEADGLRWKLAMSGRHIAHGEARKLAGVFMGESDLVQEGYIGLLRAAKRFDPDRDIRFSIRTAPVSASSAAARVDFPTPGNPVMMNNVLAIGPPMASIACHGIGD